jgi:hypothetical protein
MILLINETQMDFKTEQSQIIWFCSTLETSHQSSTVYKIYTWNILTNQCSSYDHLEKIIVKYIMVDIIRNNYCTAISQ